MTNLPGWRIDTESAFSRARRVAISPGAERLEVCCTARSSISAGTASKSMPALASSICRARLCEASTNGYFPRHRLIPKTVSFRKPLTLPVGEQFKHGGGRLLDRSSRHVELCPIEFCAQSPRERDFIRDCLAIDIIIVSGIGAHAQHPVLPHLD